MGGNEVAASRLLECLSVTELDEVRDDHVSGGLVSTNEELTCCFVVIVHAEEDMLTCILVE